MLSCNSRCLDQSGYRTARTERQHHRPCLSSQRQIRCPSSRQLPLLEINRRSAAGPQFKLPHRAVQAAAVQSSVVLAEPTVEFIGVVSGMQTVKGSLDLDADARVVYDLLTDYPSCSRVFRNIATSTLQYSEGRKQVLQVGTPLH